MSDKPEIDVQRLELLEEIRHREHAATMRAFETYRARMEDRRERQQELREFDEYLRRFNGRVPAEWAEKREAIAAKLADAERRFAAADEAKTESDERFQTAGQLHSRCVDWCKNNGFEVQA